MMRLESPASRGLLAIVGVIAATTFTIAQSFPWPPKPKGSTPAAAVETTAPAADPGIPVGAEQQAFSAPSGFATAPVAPVAAVAPPARAPVDWRILENPNGPHTALFFDPVRQVFAVYHVDSGSGQIMLKSIRNLTADLRLDQFNSSNPAPKDIQAMLEEAR